MHALRVILRHIAEKRSLFGNLVAIANDRLFTQLTDATGEPDGSTVDRDGGFLARVGE